MGQSRCLAASRPSLLLTNRVQRQTNVLQHLRLQITSSRATVLSVGCCPPGSAAARSKLQFTPKTATSMPLYQGACAPSTSSQLHHRCGRGSVAGMLFHRGRRQHGCGQLRLGAGVCSSATKDAPAAADDSVRLLPRPRLPEPDSADSSLKGNTTHNSKTAQWQQLGKGEKFAAETITETSGGASSIRFHDPAGPAPPSGNVPTGKDAGRIGSPSAAATHQAAPSGAPQHVPASTPSACAFVQSPDAPVSATAAPLGSRHDPAASPQPPPTHEPNTPLSPAPAASPCDTPAPNAQPLALLPTPLPVTAVQSTTTRDGDKAHTGQQHQRELKQQQAAPPPSACSPSPLVAAAQAALQAHLREQRLRRQHTAQRHYYHFTSAAVAHRAGEEADGQGAQAEGVLHAGDGSSEPGSYVQLRRPFPLHEQAATPGPSVGPIPPLVLPPGAATASAATPGFTPRQQAGLNGSVSMKVGVSVQGRAEDDLLWGTAPRLSDGGGLDLELEPRTHSTRSSNGASGPSDSSGAASPSFLRLAEMRAASATATQGIPATMPLPGTNSYNVDARAAGVMQPPALARPSTADVLQLPTPPSQQQLRRVKPPPHLVPPSSARLRLPDPPATIKPPTHAGQATSSYVPANTPGVTDWSAPASGSVLDASASKAASGGGGVAGAWRKGRRLLQRIGWVMGWKRQGQKQQQQQPDGATGSSMGENRTASRFDPRLLYDSDEQAKAVARAIINTYLNTPPAGSAPSAGQARQGSSRGAGSQQGVWPQVQQESGDVGHGEGGSSIHSVEQAYAALAAMAAAAAEQERLAAELAAWLPDHPVSHVAVQGEVMRLQRDLLRAQVSLWRPVELLNGRMALLGLPTGLYRELTSPDHPTLLAQALHQPLAILATFLLIVLLTAVHQQLKPRMRTRGLLMSSTAHLWLGRLAMVGFVWAVVAEAQDPGHRALVVQLHEWGVGQLVLQGPVQDEVRSQAGRRLWDLLVERVWMAWF